MAVPKFTFIDLFAGIGGIRRGFEYIGGKCVFTSEWDKFARITYAANHNETEADIAGDIWSVPLDVIPDHDVLVGGFPCQPFSLAGVSKKNALGRTHGFACDAQGTLFFRVAEILKEKRPAAFMLENVKNLVSHNKGHTFRVIQHVLEKELGYHISWKVIDGKRWTPQHRERIYIVGFREDVGLNGPMSLHGQNRAPSSWVPSWNRKKRSTRNTYSPTSFGITCRPIGTNIPRQVMVLVVLL